MIDSQSVKAPHAQTRGYDTGKKIVRRKRHIAVDTYGRLLMVNLATADISDSARAILDAIGKRQSFRIIRWRRLARDYQQRIDVSHPMTVVAMGSNLLRGNDQT